MTPITLPTLRVRASLFHISSNFATISSGGGQPSGPGRMEKRPVLPTTRIPFQGEERSLPEIPPHKRGVGG
ncbi:MAG TPA: hypothetical protein ENN44_05635 [Methanoculleus sp.]|nr:hypothetical protein [Methanoculleus sp.]